MCGKRIYAPGTIGNAHGRFRFAVLCWEPFGELVTSQRHGTQGGFFFEAGRDGAAEVVEADGLGEEGVHA